MGPTPAATSVPVQPRARSFRGRFARRVAGGCRRRAGNRIVTLAPLTRTRRVIVCCGSGGVGKTTTAAVLAMEGARQGRRAVVVTIDPAKRLADALGLETLSDTPMRIDGDWSGELWALMLDTKSTFDSLVFKY
ncbi:MAG: AAA family ATPase, partial [Acidimicrobiia bacterium]|nr:AAA family ATPase [Acidimicrobiia bacterium]